MINNFKHGPMVWLSYWVASWADLAVGLMGVLSFTFYRPNWDMDARIWFDLRIINKKLRAEREKNIEG
jgi:hypothetical protein